LKNVGPIHHCEPPHANSPDVASGTVACRLRIDVYDDNDNAWRDRYGPMEWAQWTKLIVLQWLAVNDSAVNELTLLEEHLAHKKIEWGYLSEVNCRWFAYGPADATR